MNSTLASLFFAAGVAGWVYVQVNKRTGGSSPNSVFITAGIAGVAAFIFFFTLLKYVLGLE